MNKKSKKLPKWFICLINIFLYVIACIAEAFWPLLMGGWAFGFILSFTLDSWTNRLVMAFVCAFGELCAFLFCLAIMGMDYFDDHKKPLRYILLGGILLYLETVGINKYIICFIIFLLAWCIFAYYLHWRNTDNNIEEWNQGKMIGTRDLFLETLTKIGGHYQFAEEEGDNRIFFAYQGENFFVEATNESWYIHIYYTCWAYVELYDVDEFSRLRRVINDANISNSVTTIYTINEAGGNVYVHCKSTILFMPQIPNIEEYLKFELNEFFRVHQYVNNEMAKLRENEKSSV